MPTLCPIHDTEMRQFWKKDDVNHTGQSWFSHKADDGTWCNGKPKPGSSPSRAKTIAEYEQPTEKVDWDKIAVGKVASNIATALIQAGKPLAEVQQHLDQIFKLAKDIVHPDDGDIPF